LIFFCDEGQAGSREAGFEASESQVGGKGSKIREEDQEAPSAHSRQVPCETHPKTCSKTEIHEVKAMQHDNSYRFARSVQSKGTKTDYLWVLKHPLITEKDMKKMEDENTMVYIVDNKATKP
jgi:large subunit ribosomal protein L23Ae